MIRKNSGLPPRVYEKHGAYYLVTRNNKWIRLSSLKQGLPAMYRALAAFTDAEASKDLMPAVIQRWFDSKVEAGEWTSDKTRKDQERIIKHMALEFDIAKPMDVTTPKCNEYLKPFKSQPRTFNIHRSILRQVLAFAAVEGLREGHNPIDNISQMKLKGRKRVVSDAEIRALKAAAAKSSRNGATFIQVIDLAMLTGQRIGDLLRLTWGDVTAEGLLVTQGKGGGSVKLLITWSDALRRAVYATSQGGDDDTPIILSERGRAYTYDGLQSGWERLCERAKVTDLNIHDLRGRAGVDALLEADEDIRQAQRLLGHSSESMTRHYVDGKYHKRVKPAR